MTKQTTKPCIKCGATRRYKNGSCAACSSAYNKKWRQENPDRVREGKRKWEKNNPDKVRGYQRKWAKRNPDKKRENAKRWEKNNPDKVREKNKKKNLRWCRNNPEKRRAARSRRRTAKTQAGGSYTPYEWEALCKQYDYHCLKCRREFPYKKLTADHVLPVAMGGSSNIENIQPLCRSCNSSKGAKHIDYRNKRGLLRWIQRNLF